jgi:hypothetical protein
MLRPSLSAVMGRTHMRNIGGASRRFNAGIAIHSGWCRLLRLLRKYFGSTADWDLEKENVAPTLSDSPLWVDHRVDHKPGTTALTPSSQGWALPTPGARSSWRKLRPLDLDHGVRPAPSGFDHLPR